MGAALTRERELRKAVRQARLPPRDFKIFTVLLDRADFGTAEIPGRFQPRSLEAFAGLCEMSKATLCRGLAHLVAEGWVKRGRTPGGRGCSTWYMLALGGRCYCSRPGRPTTRETVSPFPAETVSEIHPKLSHQRDLNSLGISDESAGQASVSAEGRGEGGEVRGTEPETVTDPWGPALAGCATPRCRRCGAPRRWPGAWAWCARGARGCRTARGAPGSRGGGTGERDGGAGRGPAAAVRYCGHDLCVRRGRRGHRRGRHGRRVVDRHLGDRAPPRVRG